jgi:hypothetical protein
MHRAVSPSSRLSIDLRRGDCRSGGLQPSALRTRCTRDTTCSLGETQASRTNQSSQNATIRIYLSFTARRSPRTQNCTEPVSPSSSVPIDLRRSGCPSDHLQPPALRTRCTQDTTACRGTRQAGTDDPPRKLRTFLVAASEFASSALCSRPHLTTEAGVAGPEDENSPSRVRFRPPHRPTVRFRVVPSGGASSYSRPVLGAERTLRAVDMAEQGPPPRKFAQIANRPIGSGRSA